MVEFRPVTSRLVFLLLWMLVGTIPIAGAAALGGTSTGARDVLVGFTVGVVLGVGVWRCWRMTVRFEAGGVVVRNVFTDAQLGWDDIDEITLKRFFSAKTVEEEAISLSPAFAMISKAFA